MHPTVDEQLRGVRRLLEGVAEAEPLSARSTAALQDARSMLRRLESSWSAVVPFLDWDNRATAALLDEVAALAPGAVPAVEAAARPPAGPETDFEAAHRRNLALRAGLADVIGALAGPEVEPAAAEEARRRVAAHLRERLARDPTNRRAAPSAATPPPVGASDPAQAPTDPGGRR